MHPFQLLPDPLQASAQLLLDVTRTDMRVFLATGFPYEAYPAGAKHRYAAIFHILDNDGLQAAIAIRREDNGSFHYIGMKKDDNAEHMYGWVVNDEEEVDDFLRRCREIMVGQMRIKVPQIEKWKKLPWDPKIDQAEDTD